MNVVVVECADGTKVATILDENKTIDLDAIHVQAVALEDYSIEPPLRFGRDARFQSRSDRNAPLVPGRTYRVVLSQTAAVPSTLAPQVALQQSGLSETGVKTAVSERQDQTVEKLGLVKDEIVLLTERMVAWEEERKKKQERRRKKKKELKEQRTLSLDSKDHIVSTTTISSPPIHHSADQEIPSSRSITRTSSGTLMGNNNNSTHNQPKHSATYSPLGPKTTPLTRLQRPYMGDSDHGKGKYRLRMMANGDDAAQFDDEGTRDSFEQSGGEVIEVNVGGQYFVTLRSTLCRFEGTFLEAMFSGRHLTSRDKKGRYFIDRNPTHFPAILDFLRDPSTGPDIPSTLKEREAFLREVDYYGLKEIMIGEKNEAKELCEKGYAFYNGKGVPKDIKKAVELWTRAAELGDARAQNRLAICYKNGDGVEQDYFKAIPLYEKAAEQGHRDAQYNLACRYKNGEGVPYNKSKAIEWFLKAESQGDTDARRMLENMGVDIAKARKAN